MNHKLFMEDCVYVANRIYFFSKDWNGLFVTDIESGETRLLSTIPEEEVLAGRLCAGIMHFNGKLVLMPMHARKIWIYDLENDQWRGIEREYMANGDLYKEIFRAVAYRNNFFLIGSNYPAIIKMNIDTLEIEYWTEPYKFLLSTKSKRDGFFRCDFLLKNNELFLASCINNYVLRLNLDSSDFIWCEVGEKNFRYSGITWDGEFYWLSPRTGTPIVKWDGKKDVEYFPLPERYDNATNNFLGVQYNNGRLVFPGMLQKYTLVINPRVPYDMEECEGQYLFYRCDDEGRVFSQSVDGLLQFKDSKSNKQYDIYCEIAQEYIMNYLTNEHKNRSCGRMGGEIKKESVPLFLPLYITLLNNDDMSKDMESGVGEEIWETIRS